MIGKSYALVGHVRFDEGGQDFYLWTILNGHEAGNGGYSQGLSLKKVEPVLCSTRNLCRNFPGTFCYDLMALTAHPYDSPPPLLPLYNIHSQAVKSAQRLSPTRFIPNATWGILSELRCFQASARDKTLYDRRQDGGIDAGRSGDHRISPVGH